MNKEIYLAGGCFWGLEAYFSRIPGVLSTSVGYANGPNPEVSYEEVCHGSGHAEAVQVRYSSSEISLEILLKQFFKIIDPFSINRQGNDRGIQYRTGIYYTDTADAEVARRVISAVENAHHRKVAVELAPLKDYCPAEEYHQQYLDKNPGGYCHISFDSLSELNQEPARDRAGSATPYTKPSDSELKARLTEMQYRVTQLNATEPPFSGKYWNSNERGLYVDIATGEPLFLSEHKFDSPCGWASFAKPVQPTSVLELEDLSFGMRRTEVRSRVGNSHLGHVFPDGPRELGGQRYCINSAALRFIPYDKLDEEGYAEFKACFGNND